MDSFFQNHELVKLNLQFPLLSALVVYSGLILLICAQTEKVKPKASFLCKDITNQLRGLAILLVVTGHIGIHVIDKSDQTVFPVLGWYGVSLFFILSGFGLARSYTDRPFLLNEFIKRRLMKVMVPYWFVTILILVADYVFLGKRYDFSDIFLTAIGVNITEVTKHIDYVRWYITVLLIWYCFFGFFEWRGIKKKSKTILLLATGILLFLFSYYFIAIGYAYLSFPFGVFIGLYYKDISRLYNTIQKRNLWIVSILFYIVIYVFQIIDTNLPSIIVSMTNELLLISFSISTIIQAELLKNYRSKFLLITGALSYSIFLIHTPLMIKYDFLLFRGPLFITFWIYLLVIISISMATKRIMLKT